MKREEILGFDEVHVATVMTWGALGWLMIGLSWFIDVAPDFDYGPAFELLGALPVEVSILLVVLAIMVGLFVCCVILTVPFCALYFALYEVYLVVAGCIGWVAGRCRNAYRKARAEEIREDEIVKEATLRILGR